MSFRFRHDLARRVRTPPVVRQLNRSTRRFRNDRGCSGHTGLVENIGSVTTSQGIHPENNTVSESTLLGVADLSSIADSPDPADRELLTYSVTVTNRGLNRPRAWCSLTSPVAPSSELFSATVSQGVVFPTERRLGAIPVNDRRFSRLNHPAVSDVFELHAAVSSQEGMSISNNERLELTAVNAGPGWCNESADTVNGAQAR